MLLPQLPMRQIGQGIVNSQNAAVGQNLTGYLNSMNAMAQPEDVQREPLIRKDLLIPLAIAEMISRLRGGEGAIGPYLGTRQMVLGRQEQDKEAEREQKRKGLAIASEIARIKYMESKGERDRTVGLFADAEERQRRAVNDNLTRQNRMNMNLDRLMDNYRQSRSKGQMIAARAALNAYATENGLPEYTVDDSSFNSDISALGNTLVKTYGEELGRTSDRYGYVPDSAVGYFNAKRKAIADEFYGGNMALVPEAISEKTLKARQFEFHKGDADRKFKFLGDKERNRIAEAKANLDLKRRQVDIAERNAVTAEGRNDLAQARIDLDRAEFDYKKSLPKEAQVNGELKSIDNQIRQKRIAQQASSDKDKRMGLEEEINNLLDYKRTLTATKEEIISNVGQMVPGAQAQPAPQKDTRIVGNTGKTRDQLIAEANAAIAQGADRKQVMARLRGMGVSVNE